MHFNRLNEKKKKILLIKNFWFHELLLFSPKMLFLYLFNRNMKFGIKSFQSNCRSRARNRPLVSIVNRGSFLAFFYCQFDVLWGIHE